MMRDSLLFIQHYLIEVCLLTIMGIDMQVRRQHDKVVGVSFIITSMFDLR